MDKFLELLADILDTDVELTVETELEEVEEWDSLAWLHFMTMADEEYGKEVTGEQLGKCATVQDLFGLIS